MIHAFEKISYTYHLDKINFDPFARQTMATTVNPTPRSADSGAAGRVPPWRRVGLDIGHVCMLYAACRAVQQRTGPPSSPRRWMVDVKHSVVAVVAVVAAADIAFDAVGDSE